MESTEEKIRRLELEVATLRSAGIAPLSAEDGNAESEPQVRNPASAPHAGDRRFQLLVDCVQDYAIFMIDPIGNVLTWNTGAERIQGYREDEILGRNFSCLYLAEDITDGKPPADIASALVSGRLEEEALRTRKGGETFWAQVVATPVREEDGKLQGLAIVTRDVSERRRQDEKARLMVQLAINAMILVNARGEIVLANPQTETLFGYTQTELLGQPIELLVPESARANHPAQRDKFFANPSIRAMGAGRDLFGRRKDGTQFPVEIGLNPIHSSEGLLVLGSIVDITERKRAEEKSRRHLAELAHAGRLSSIGEMYSELAHELNQPLAAAANYARACVRCAESQNAASEDQLLDWMRKAAHQAERASDIVKRIGTFAKKERAVWTEVSINQLIYNVVSLLQLTKADTGNDTAVRLRLDHTLPNLVVDKVQIEQVLLNLVRNAMEAMEATSPVTRRLEINSEQLGDSVRVSVCDNGHGITPEEQARLFTPFFTTKPEGMGLGLSISRSIIEQHHGRLFIEPNLGGGTRVVFKLPIRKEEAVT